MKIALLRLAPTAFALALLAPAALAQANDDCTGATPATAGVAIPFSTVAATTSATAFPCGAGGGPDLWYSFTTTGPAGSVLTAETCGSSFDTVVEILSGTCGALVSEACNDDSCSQQSSVSAQNAGPGTTYYVRVGGYSGAVGAGSLVINEGGLFPTCQQPDSLEPNLDCPTATRIGDGTYVGLNVTDLDQDYYLVTVPPAGTLSVDLLFSDAFADIDLFLWNPALDCDTNVAGVNGAWLARSNSASDNESITYTNPTAAALDLVVEVDMWTAGGCNDYDMIISGSVPPAANPIGTPFCPGNPNSTGLAGAATAVGSTSVAANDVTLRASNLPPMQFGIFVTSETAGAPATVGSGALCLSGAVGRFNQPGQIWQANASGDASLAIDLTLIPLPSTVAVVQPGDTWYFQAWYRDFAGMSLTSNFTGGVSVTFS